MSEDKAIKKSIALRENLLKAADERAKSHFRNNFSAYIQDLLERDLRGGDWPTVTDEALDILASKFHPAGYGSFSEWQVDQSELLAGLLRTLAFMGQECRDRQPSVLIAEPARNCIEIRFGAIADNQPINLLLNRAQSPIHLSIVEESRAPYSGRKNLPPHDKDQPA